MAKTKLHRFEENLTFRNLIQPKIIYPPTDHELKGKWKDVFFRNSNPIVLELGCGRGEYTLFLASLFPEKNFIGIDWKGARLWRGAKTGIETNANNIGFLRIQIQNINFFFEKDEVDEIWITFPDPQMTKPGERKRLTSLRFLNLYKNIMSANGIINLKTDSKELFDYTMELIRSQNLKVIIETDDLYSEDRDQILSVKTTYEKIWLKAGSKICYVRFCINVFNE